MGGSINETLYEYVEEIKYQEEKEPTKEKKL